VLPDILNVVSSTWASYLSVIPINETIPLARDDCFSFYSQYITDDWTINGMADADMAIYVGAETSTIEGGEEVILCSPRALAFAFTCAIDQFERPIIGAINFCIDNIQRRLEEEVETDGRTLRVGNDGRKLDLNEEKLVYQAVTLDGNTQGSDMTLVAIHEVCHALGFTFNLVSKHECHFTIKSALSNMLFLLLACCLAHAVQVLSQPRNGRAVDTSSLCGHGCSVRRWQHSKSYLAGF
jgi:hypothetical protein